MNYNLKFPKALMENEEFRTLQLQSKLIYMLLLEADDYTKLKKGGKYRYLRISKKKFAEYLNISPATLNRYLVDLEAHGLIQETIEKDPTIMGELFGWENGYSKVRAIHVFKIDNYKGIPNSELYNYLECSNNSEESLFNGSVLIL